MRLLIIRFDHEWVDVTAERLTFCCDCGLAHRVNFRIVPSEDGDHIIRQAIRDKRATANLRRSFRTRQEEVFQKGFLKQLKKKR